MICETKIYWNAATRVLREVKFNIHFFFFREKPCRCTGMRSGGVREKPSIRILWGFGDLNFWDFSFGKLFHSHPSASTRLLTEKKKVNVELQVAKNPCGYTFVKNRLTNHIERVYIYI